ncbi:MULTISPECIES: hypothetical protein [Thermus]|uniref:hypothetical protein n=1 Tax=Thermus TaxID=270 RepID=UPI00156244DF|nr:MULTISPECIES: hypothetical protein [Thermus]MCS6869606.1 hypothetical protein [Thermus sp.]MCX7850169.1 hypothetical protein [Thermus sp.]MDW8017182.1 hypothetical protein [Thermus sp.]MDW8357650.1 hypothetical protein [Thermus sp.]
MSLRGRLAALEMAARRKGERLPPWMGLEVHEVLRLRRRGRMRRVLRELEGRG